MINKIWINCLENGGVVLGFDDNDKTTSLRRPDEKRNQQISAFCEIASNDVELTPDLISEIIDSTIENEEIIEVQLYEETCSAGNISYLTRKEYFETKSEIKKIMVNIFNHLNEFKNIKKNLSNKN